MVLTSKLIDGTFPDYQRVIPTGNDKKLVIDRQSFAQAVDRVSTISSERGRAVKLSIADGQVTLAVNNPDSGSATEELPADYSSEPLEIGFNARYLLDVAAQLIRRRGEIHAGRCRLADADPGHRRRAGALRADADACLTARLEMRDGGLQMAISALPVLTYLHVRCAPVLEIAIFVSP